MQPATSLVLTALSLVAAAPVAWAEGSPPLSEDETRILAEAKRPPEAVEAFFAYLLELDRRHAESGGLSDAELAEESETAAVLYCRAIGIDGPCAPQMSGATTRYAAVDARMRPRWWDWMEGHTSHIGVIPETPWCSAPYALVEIYMDDENRANNNARSGWIGATVSNADTRWRFCKLDISATNRFFPIDPSVYPSGVNDYAVQSFGRICPLAARRVIRYQDNEDANNGNSFAGSIFPNSVSGNGSWMVTCHYDASAPALWSTMTAFPQLPFHYGVFADPSMFWPFTPPHGRVYQDDEDSFNLNIWIGSPAGTMQGGRNTERFLIKAF